MTDTDVPVLKTALGLITCADSRDILADYADGSVDCIVTSPPFGLVRKKEYGNVDAADYLEWFASFAANFHRVLTENGSLVIDIGGAWNRGMPTRSLYHFKLAIMLCEDFGFHLAQEFYWWNPSKLPSPAEWVTVRRIRVKDAVNTVWWLSKTPWPKASNRRVLQPYSGSMQDLLANGYRPMRRPSGHDISGKFSSNNGAAIPPNLIAIPNTESNGIYQRYCKERGIDPHPARFPSRLPEYFIRMLTNPGDLVVDPFAGSCVTGEVCERLNRRWHCIESDPEYCEGAKGRFLEGVGTSIQERKPSKTGATHYQIPAPGLLWAELDEEPLQHDGGIKRSTRTTKAPDPQSSPQVVDKAPVPEEYASGTYEPRMIKERRATDV